MSGGGIKVDTRALDRALGELRDRVTAMPDTHAEVAGSLVDGIAQRTPVRSGELAASWEARGEPDRGLIESTAEYAWIIEAREHMVADTLAASERTIVEGYEQGVASSASRIGFGVKS
jgi:hypothetical protein